MSCSRSACWSIAFPVYVTFVASTQTSQEIVQAPMSLLPGDNMLENYRVALLGGETSSAPRSRRSARMMLVSLVTRAGHHHRQDRDLAAVGVRDRLLPLPVPARSSSGSIFVTLMLPVEVRIFPTYKVVSDLGMLNTYAGLTMPLIASATATFLFRQFFLTVPDELVEAARIDGAGPLRFFKDVLVPLSATSIAALFVIQFIYGWNQYLWPLLMTTDESMYPVVIGIKRMIGGGDAANEWNVVMATAILAMIPPALVVILMQRWFVKGLVDAEK